MSGWKIFFSVLAALAVFTLLVVGGCAALVGGAVEEAEKSVSEPKDKNDKDEPRSLSENKEHPPKDDVEVGPIEQGEFGVNKVKVTYTNPTSKMSDYSVQFRYLDASGKQVGEDVDLVTNVKPGATATSGDGLLPPDDAVKVEIATVDRYASAHN